MKNIAFYLSIVFLTLLAHSILASEKSLVENTVSSDIIEKSNITKSVEKSAITSCSCPGFSYTTGVGALTRSHYASQCSASCPSPKFASCTCSVTSYGVAGNYYNSCGCK